MRLFFATLSLLLLSTSSVMAWGKKGHDVICYIAECHLRDSALRRVDELLEGRSMLYYSSWMDSASNTPKYDYSKPWHYFNIDRGKSIDKMSRSKDGDVLFAVERIVEQLKGGELTMEDEQVALKMLIHLVGDMHQPMHLGREHDQGGGTIPIVYFVESVSLHALWDYHIVEGVHAWSYSEWQDQLDRGFVDYQVITSGSYMDWMRETHKITEMIYRDTPAETRVFYEYIDKYTLIVEQQLLYAGLRLSWILNDIYK